MYYDLFINKFVKISCLALISILFISCKLTAQEGYKYEKRNLLNFDYNSVLISEKDKLNKIGASLYEYFIGKDDLELDGIKVVIGIVACNDELDKNKDINKKRCNNVISYLVENYALRRELFCVQDSGSIKIDGNCRARIQIYLSRCSG